MIKNIQDEIMTPNQAAKYIIQDFLDRTAYWSEGAECLFHTGDYSDTQITETEKQKINEQLEKRINGLIKYMGGRL